MDFGGIAISSEDPTTRFDFEAKVGEGSYGAVYKAVDKVTGKEVAIKVLDLQGDDSQIADLRREINILQSCNSPYIVGYAGSFSHAGSLWIAMEYCGAGSVSDLMAICDTTLGELEISAVMYQSLLGLDYLHRQKKIHRDIKSGNILLTDDGNCKIADFGVSAELATTLAKSKTMIGTPYFLAPEVLMNTEYDKKADIWSLGITAYELAVGQPPLADVHPMRAIFQIPNSPPPRLPEELESSPQFKQFIECCLQKNPNDRLDAAQLTKLPFFDKVRSESASTSVILGLLGRCKASIDEWRAMDALEQQQQNCNNPYNQSGEGDAQDYEMNGNSTVQFNPTSTQQQFQGTVRIKPQVPQAAYNDNTVDMGTMVIKKQPPPQQGTMKKNPPANTGGYCNTSGTMVARPLAGPSSSAQIPPPSNANLNTLSSNSLVSSLNSKSTRQEIEQIRLTVEANKTKDLTQISAFYDQRLRELERMLQGK